jgi:hypothetical protein
MDKVRLLLVGAAVFLAAQTCAFAQTDASSSLFPAVPLSLSSSSSASSDEPDYDCACGCGIFDVGTSSMIPSGKGGTVWFEYDFQDQNINWSGSSRAPAADNPDKEIRTSFFTFGVQYMFSRDWGFQAELPFADRYFRTTGGATGNEIVSLEWPAMGDLRVEGIYTGFFPDMSAGVTFGFNDQFDDVDRDSEIGTGSTDALLGGFYRNNITSDGSWTWFAQALLDVPMVGRDDYLPGVEFDSAAGVYYNRFSIGHVPISPIAQVLYTARAQDSGNEAASPVASGYQRIFLSPGVEVNLHPFMLYADAELPVYQYMNGDQLTAPVLIKFIVSYSF